MGGMGGMGETGETGDASEEGKEERKVDSEARGGGELSALGSTHHSTCRLFRSFGSKELWNWKSTLPSFPALCAGFRASLKRSQMA